MNLKFSIVRTALAAVVSAMMASASAHAADPAISAGMDPGGTAVAIIGAGIDYTLPEITARLARDGEGDIVGFDYADEDHRPYATGTTPSTITARTIVASTPNARLIPLRVEAADAMSVARAIAHAAQGPAKIIALDHATAYGPGGRALSEAAAHFSSHLFIIAAGDDGADLNAARNPPATPNILIVTAAGPDGTLFPSSNRGNNAVDLALILPTAPAVSALLPQDSNAAAAYAVATALQLLGSNANLEGEGLKQAIIGLASSGKPGQEQTTKSGLLPATKH